jgi:antirestriction protein ArdC
MSVFWGSDHYWLTFRQALALGGNVRKGEKGAWVVYWHWRTAEDLEALRAQGKNPAPCYPIYSTVFNWAQCDGLEVPQDDTQTFTHTPREEAERIWREMPNAPKVEFKHDNSAGYAPTQDTIAMPHAQRFTQSEGFYAVLFHELAHATGHASRLNRLDSKKHRSFGSPEYSFEELVAEMTAAFLCAHCGMENRVEQSAAYIDGWLGVLRQDKKILLDAATAAQQAADYILGQSRNEEQNMTESD